MLLLVWFINSCKCHVVEYWTEKLSCIFDNLCSSRKYCYTSVRPQAMDLRSTLRNWLLLYRENSIVFWFAGDRPTCSPCVTINRPHRHQCHVTRSSYLTQSQAVYPVASLTGTLYFSVMFLGFHALHLRVLT